MSEAERGFLGLTHNPFVQPDKGFFEQADRKTHLDALRHLSQWSRRVLLVTGPQGIGKSVLYRQLSTSLEPRCKAARIHGSLINASREVLVSVAQGFGIAAPAQANAQLLTSLIERHVEEQSAAERICVVMVDDADMLEPRAVVDLMTLASACNLQLVLFGDMKLVPAIERTAGRLGLGWHEIRLSGFSEQQTRDYLEWRFQQARYRGRLPFTESQVKEIQRISEGTPGKINQMANVLLVKLETGDIGRNAPAFPALHRALLGLLLVVVGLLYLLWRQGEDTATPIVVAEQEQVAAPADETPQLPAEAFQEVPMESPDELPEPADPRQSPMASQQSSGQLRQGPASSIASQPADGIPFGQQPEFPATADEPEAVPLEVAEPVPDETSDPAPVTVTGNPGTLDTPIAQPLDPAPDASGPASTAAPDAPDSRPPLPEVVQEVSVSALADAQDTTGPAVPPSDPETDAAEAEVSAQVEEPAAAATDVSVSAPRDAQWLLAQPGDRYTLQLVSVSSAERAQAYMQQQSQPGEFASYELERDGRRLHVVVYGLFDSQSEADAAARALPATVGNVTPWIRTLEQVHGAIYTVR